MDIKILVGKVKNNCSEESKGLEGMEVIVHTCSFEKNKYGLVGPIKLDDMEKYYKLSYEEDLKDWISDEYENCLYYVLNHDCELVPNINKDDVEIIRELTKEDDAEYSKNIEQFKQIHHYYDIEKRLKDDEEAEEKADEEFKKTEKSKVRIKTREGDKTIDGIIYKGFAVHDGYGCVESSYKTITVIGGELDGVELTGCSVAKYKQLIDEVRKVIGDRAVEQDDRDILIPIIEKY